MQLIRDLKDEVAKLREFIKAEGLEGKIASFGLGGLAASLMAEGGKGIMSKEMAMEKLRESEKLMDELKMSWEEKLQRTQYIMKER